MAVKKRKTVSNVTPVVSSVNLVSKTSKTKRAVVGLAAVILVLFLLRSFLVVAIVNGQPIWRPAVVAQLEKEGGKRVYDQMLTETLIMQEAKSKGVEVSDKEVEDRIKEIENSLSSQGQTLDGVLALQGLTKDELTKQIKIQIMVEKILGEEISVTDKEITDYIANEENAAFLTGTEEKNKVQAEEQLKQQKLSAKFAQWLEDLRKKANILQIFEY